MLTRDLLEPAQLRRLTRYDVGPLAERSRYGPGPVKVSCEWEGAVPLWTGLREGYEQGLNSVIFWQAFAVNHKLPFHKNCSNFLNPVNFLVLCKRSGYLEQFWTALE